MPELRKSQGLNCWHSDLASFVCLALSHLPTVLSSFASLLCRRDQEAQANKFCLHLVTWIECWFIRTDFCKVTYSSQTQPPMVKAQVLTVGHEGKYSLPLPGPVGQLMATRTGKLRRGSPAKQPRAWHMCEGNSDLPAQTILASHTCVFWVLPLLNLTYKICCTCLCQLHSVHTVNPTHIPANLLCTGSCCCGLPFQLGDRCFCLCTCALTWHWSQCAEGGFYSMKKFVVEPLFPGVGYKTVSSVGAEANHQKAEPLFLPTSSCHTELS